MMSPSRQRQSILSFALVSLGAICLPAYLILNNNSNNGGVTVDIDGERFGRRALQEELENDAQMYRILSSLGDEQSREEDLSIPDYLLHAGEEGFMSAEEAIARASDEAALTPHPQPNPPPYTILDVLNARKVFRNTYGILIYDNAADEFLFLYGKDQQWVSGCTKLKMSFMKWTYMLRETFPERFCGPQCDEWAVGFSSGDYPHLHPDTCLLSFPRASEACPVQEAPVFQFGSVFRDYEPLPNMIAMPMPLTHMPCMEQWVASGSKFICNKFKPNTRRGSLAFGEDDLEWEKDLKPQIVWRGTDFGYLNHLYHVESVETGRAAAYEVDIPQEVKDMKDDSMERRMAATQSMRSNYHNLGPRWKGVVLTAEAEREHELKVNEAAAAKKGDNGPSLPWADIRFTQPSVASNKWHNAPAYTEFADLGIEAIGKPMNGKELSSYKYHIDLGGGGGTTWTGTHSKLAMPGLLFHHVTPTKDYIHDRMKPWVHYVPVKADLSDLKEKYDWAESHSEVAKRISHHGSNLMRRIGSHVGFEELFQDDFVEPMQRVMDAYRPVSVTHPATTAEGGGNAQQLSWRQIIRQAEADHGFWVHRVKLHCTGKAPGKNESCREGGKDETV